MNNSNEQDLANSLAQIPQLVENTQTIIEETGRNIAILAEAMQQRMTAVIPPSEVSKVANAAANAVARTRCVIPDLGQINDGITKEFMSTVRDATYKEASNAVKDAIAKTPVTLKHKHEHVFTAELVKYANEKVSRLIYIILLFCAALVFGIGANAITYISSEEYLAKEYLKVCTSKYITDAEYAELVSSYDIYGILPEEYKNATGLAKDKIERNKKILKQRKKEARKDKDGKFSTAIPLER